MAHATPKDLEGLEVLLQKIRTISALKEKSLGCFYYKSKAALHFHVKQGRRYAHVSDGKNWHEVDLPENISVLAQNKSLAKIRKLLPLD